MVVADILYLSGFLIPPKFNQNACACGNALHFSSGKCISSDQDWSLMHRYDLIESSKFSYCKLNWL